MRIKRVALVGLVAMLCILPLTIQANAYDWLVGWDYRRSITITGQTGAGTNYPVQVNVTYETGMQSTFGDLRFTDNDGITQLHYWLEEYVTESYAICWVNVTDSLETSASIFAYWGNDEVSTTSNGHNVFFFFDDFETGDLTDYWQTVQASWTTVTSVKVHGARAAFADSGANRELSNDNDIDETGWADGNTDLMIHAWCREQSIVGDSYMAYLTDSDAGVYAALLDFNDFVTYTTAAGVIPYVSNCFLTQTWYELEVGIDFTNTEFVPYVDGVAGTVQTLQDKNSAAVDVIDKITLYCDPTANRDFWVDDYYVRKWVAGDCSVDSFGETETGPSWHELSPASVWFELLSNTLSGFYVLIGMMMIIGGPTYLAYARKSDSLSLDKFFIFLVLFIFGWAMVIGGIGP